WHLVGDRIYFYSPQGYGRAKMNNNFFEKKLKQVVFIPYAEGKVHKQEAVIKATLLQNPHIKEVAFSKAVPLNMYGSSKISKFEGSTGDENFSSYRNAIDYNFLALYDMEIVDGQAFSKKPSTDTLQQYILNETAVKSLGWENPIGKNFNDGRVVGVVKDFHFQPLHLAIQPLYLRLASSEDLSYYGSISVKVDGQNMKQTLDHIAGSMKSIIPAIPFEYQFLDEALQKLYRKEQQLGRMFSVFTGLAVLIALLGLLGLASYNVVRRAKEISIRKVLGASAAGIIRMLFRDYLRLIILALALATPLAFYLMQGWLDNFAYRIDLAKHWLLFVLIGLAAVVLPLTIIGLQSLRTARANPADKLRS
ncbi:MAG: FtsX-like permease family protein, partial [Bacteroidota bacterium]